MTGLPVEAQGGGKRSHGFLRCGGELDFSLDRGEVRLHPSLHRGVQLARHAFPRPREIGERGWGAVRENDRLAVVELFFRQPLRQLEGELLEDPGLQADREDPLVGLRERYPCVAERGRHAGYEVRIDRIASLALDLDTPDDLERLVAALREAPDRAPTTAAELARMGRIPSPARR